MKKIFKELDIQTTKVKGKEYYFLVGSIPNGIVVTIVNSTTNKFIFSKEESFPITIKKISSIKKYLMQKVRRLK